jgi:peptidoglycan hydrolase FlgJ
MKPINPTSAPVNIGNITPDPALRKAAQGFEAIFMREVIGSMRKARLGEDIFGSSATDQFREMADARTADEMAKMGTFGIAKLLETQLAKHGGKS